MKFILLLPAASTEATPTQSADLGAVYWEANSGLLQQKSIPLLSAALTE
jgi:hypothetical protein